MRCDECAFGEFIKNPTRLKGRCWVAPPAGPQRADRPVFRLGQCAQWSAPAAAQRCGDCRHFRLDAGSFSCVALGYEMRDNQLHLPLVRKDQRACMLWEMADGEAIAAAAEAADEQERRG